MDVGVMPQIASSGTWEGVLPFNDTVWFHKLFISSNARHSDMESLFEKYCPNTMPIWITSRARQPRGLAQIPNGDLESPLLFMSATLHGG
jgi:hypothetical protein